MSELYTETHNETVKKSQMCAKTQQEYQYITESRLQFLDCSITEEKETIDMTFVIGDKKEFSMIREEKRINRLKALLEIGKLLPLFKSYQFSLMPGNLYYDRNYRMYVKNRDVYERGISGSEEEFLEQYKALIAHTLQKKYSYEDYYAGGRDLYRKHPLLKQVYEAASIAELETFLLEEYGKEEDIALHQTLEVNKKSLVTFRWGFCVSVSLLLVSVGMICYLMLVQLPRKNAFIQANNSYLSGNYIQVIDSLQNMDMKYLDSYQKYILAVSYIKGESLTPQQKENILAKVEISGEEKVKEYWIYLGRLDTLEAENIAMQRSDNEMLLYAYMTEKAVTEKDSEITGEEKATKLDDLEKKIEELAKQYEDTTTEN